MTLHTGQMEWKKQDQVETSGEIVKFHFKRCRNNARENYLESPCISHVHFL